MHITHGRMPGADSIKQATNFTGTVYADPIIGGLDAVAVNHVFFGPRSRTFWHSHRDGQVLHVTNGSGFVSSKTGGIVSVQPGDVVWSEPGDVHWHGAGEHTYLLHTAISLGQTDWLDEVTEEEYLEALAAHQQR